MKIVTHTCSLVATVYINSNIMADFKMVENRKYNDEEIRYVVSRVHAGWDPAIIAKAFKHDHGEYWADREFTKKQVAYIRCTYKPPPG